MHYRNTLYTQYAKLISDNCDEKRFDIIVCVVFGP